MTIVESLVFIGELRNCGYQSTSIKIKLFRTITKMTKPWAVFDFNNEHKEKFHARKFNLYKKIFVRIFIARQFNCICIHFSKLYFINWQTM